MELFPNRRLIVSYRDGAKMRYDDAYDFLQLHAAIFELSPDDARRKLAEYLSWPFCVIEDWMPEGVVHRTIRKSRLIA